MKNIRFLTVVVIALLTTISCKTDVELQTGEIKVIDLAGAVGGGKIVNISDVADDIKYVALETTDSSLIGERARVQVENGRIYVHSRKSNTKDIKVFDIDGKYLFTFNRTGRGPEEYSRMSKIEIDNVTGGFIAFDIIPSTSNSKSLGHFKEYDKHGNYIKTTIMPVIDPGRLETVKRFSQTLYISPVGSNSTAPMKIHGAAFDTLNNIVFELPLTEVPEYIINEMQEEIIGIEGLGKERKVFYTLPPTIEIIKNQARIFSLSNDTIFTLDQKLNYYPTYAINRGKYVDTSPDRSNISYVKGNHINLDPESYVESTRFIIMDFIMRNFAHEPYDEYIQGKNRVITVPRTNCYGIYDKQTGFFNLMNQSVKGKLGFREDLKNGPPFIPAHISKDDFASALFSAVQIIEHAEVYDVKGELKEILSKLKDTDNPVVAIARFK
ncbi:MAG: hypothetical protein A2X19_03070 [Bacteroidetes bacterium GWE2_39_28]|nr:MAG: hypothetical protein A2X19_03070 [Bacteroidetes bacterium GWE2_39_28]OFZ10092.1 MAG: hypothetical protein A2465_11335 [Bacteroidetes bacterium RIFOXYC2_FULL_39_11]HCT94429.1 hypothetical protein [Rikenellaceae bacterium]